MVLRQPYVERLRQEEEQAKIFERESLMKEIEKTNKGEHILKCKRVGIFSNFHAKPDSADRCHSHMTNELFLILFCKRNFHYQRVLDHKRLPVMSDFCVVCLVPHWLPVAVVPMAMLLSALETRAVSLMEQRMMLRWEVKKKSKSWTHLMT